MSEWSDDEIATLRRLWGEGASAREIAEQLPERSRNAVIGRAHRINLAARDNPIDHDKPPPTHARNEAMARRYDEVGSYVAVGREFGMSPDAAQKAIKRYRARLVREADRPAKQASKRVLPMRPRQKRRPKPVIMSRTTSSHVVVGPVLVHDLPAPSVAAVTAYPAPAGHQGRTCQWPIGDPREPGFHFCGGVPRTGKPYCDAHCAVAYRRTEVASLSAGGRSLDHRPIGLSLIDELGAEVAKDAA